MGSYLSTAKFVELSLLPMLGINKRKTAERLANSGINHIQTTRRPTKREMEILNEVFRINPKIIFRLYGLSEKDSDISYLSELPDLRALSLELYYEVKNIEVLYELALEDLTLACFGLKDYSFLRDLSPSLKCLTVDLEDKTYRMDVSDILHMTGLESMALRNVKRGLDKIGEFKNLKELYLRSVDIKDYGFLREMGVRKIYLSFQNVEYFNTFGINESIEEVSLWMNKKLTDLSFLLQFPNLKKIIISNQKRVEAIPDLTGLQTLEEIYFLDRDAEEIRACCNPWVKIHTGYNPVDIS